MDKEKALEKIVELIAKGKRAYHKHYDRTVQIAKEAKMINTAKGQDKYLNQYRLRETDKQKEQRNNLTNSLTPFAASQMFSYFDKVESAENVKINHSGNEEGRKKVKSKLSKFHDRQSLDRYMFDRFKYFNEVDPNAFCIVEMEDEKNLNGAIENRTVYPLEATSDQVVGLGRKNGSYEYIIICHDVTPNKIKNKDGMYVAPGVTMSGIPKSYGHYNAETRCNFYLYAAGVMIGLEEIGSDETMEDVEITDITLLDELDGETKTKRRFALQVHDTGTNECPAFCFGVYPDKETAGESKVTILQPAMPLFLDLIQVKSEEDLTRTLHVFMQKIMYAPVCRHTHTSYGDCNNGCYGNTNHECTNCKGEGHTGNVTTQDAIVLKIDKNFKPSEMLDLKKLVAYVDQPEFTPKYLGEMIQRALKFISLSIYNTNVFDKPEFSNSKIGVGVNYERINRKLVPYGRQYSKGYELVARIAAQYLSVVDFEIDHKFGNDFRLQSLSEMIQEYGGAKTAGLSSDILQSMEAAILRKQHIDNPDTIKDIEAWLCYKPFKDKPDNIIIAILGRRDPLDYDRILWENFDIIKKEVERKIGVGTFGNMLDDKRKELIDNKVDEYRERLRQPTQVAANQF